MSKSTILADGHPLPTATYAAYDPIFAAIESHKESVRAVDVANNVTDLAAAEREGRVVTAADGIAGLEASDAEGRTLGEVLRLAPVTEAGMLAVLRYVAALDNGFFLSERVSSLLKSPAPAL